MKDNKKTESVKDILNRVWIMSHAIWTDNMKETAKINYELLKEINYFCAKKLNNLK